MECLAEQIECMAVRAATRFVHGEADSLADLFDAVDQASQELG